MENYTKVVLYAYPLLRTVGEDYAEHIRNKALLSYDSAMTTERLAEYLAEEILCKERLEWLKRTVEDVLSRLSDVERTLVAIRYFGKTKKTVDICVTCAIIQKSSGKGNKIWGYSSAGSENS